MGLFDWVGDFLHDRAMHTAYWNATRRLRARLAEEEKYLKKQEAKKEQPLLVPLLPDPFLANDVLPNSFLILDHWDEGFSVAEFLAQRGGALKDWTDPVTGLKASYLIDVAARNHMIDPRLLLVTLQREKSLVRSQKLSDKALDWACGVGAWDAGAWAQRYKGFDKQLNKAAETYRNRFNQFQPGEEMSVDFGKNEIVPKNAATRSLYVYTPHVFAAKLTWTVWKGFFGV